MSRERETSFDTESTEKGEERVSHNGHDGHNENLF
jgi:hypothetical protein